MVQTRNIAIQLVLQNNLHVFYCPFHYTLRGLYYHAHFYGCKKKTSILPGLVIYSVLKDDAFTATKKEAAF